jgi:hypothetical protein
MSTMSFEIRNFKIRSIMIQEKYIVDENIRVYDCIIHLFNGIRAKTKIQDRNRLVVFEKFDILTAPCPYCIKRPLCDCSSKYIDAFERQVNHQFGLFQLEVLEFNFSSDIIEYWEESRLRFLGPHQL